MQSPKVARTQMPEIWDNINTSEHPPLFSEYTTLKSFSTLGQHDFGNNRDLYEIKGYTNRKDAKDSED